MNNAAAIRIVFQVASLADGCYAFGSYSEASAIEFARASNRGHSVPRVQVERCHIVAGRAV